MLIWSSKFETGHPQLDAEHKRLIDELNNLEESLKKGMAKEKIPAILDFLENYSKKHFANEEKCMDHYKCPYADRNKNAHKQFMAKFANARKELNQKGITLSLVLKTHKELSQWVKQHILTIDTHLKPCIKK